MTRFLHANRFPLRSKTLSIGEHDIVERRPHVPIRGHRRGVAGIPGRRYGLLREHLASSPALFCRRRGGHDGALVEIGKLQALKEDVLDRLERLADTPRMNRKVRKLVVPDTISLTQTGTVEPIAGAFGHGTTLKRPAPIWTIWPDQKQRIFGHTTAAAFD